MKTEHAVLAGHYADAILQICIQDGGEANAEKVWAEIKAINQIIKNTEYTEVVLDHPAIKTDEKRQLLVNSFGSAVSEMTLRVLELLLDKRRLSLLPQIEEAFHQLLNARKNIVSASLTSADKLDESAIANIKARLTEHLGKTLELDVKVDSSLIGGVMLKLGDQVIDGSIKGKLQNLERVLMSV